MLRSLLLSWWLLVCLCASSAQALIIGTYNIRYANSGDVAKGNGWEQRAPVIAGLVQFHGFDAFGVQEALYPQLKKLEELLPDYAWLGQGRDDGKSKGEHSAIFYRKDRFKALESGQFWFSETPEVPSKGWDAALPRVCTWVKLESLADHRTFHLFNLHLDHVGVKARLESTRLVLRRIREIAGEQPVVLTGDFNVDQTNEGYRVIASSGVLTDAYESAPIRYALNGTANAFDPNARTESRIDHIFLSRHFKARRYGVLTDSYRAPAPQSQGETSSGAFPKEVKFRDYQARLPSDHFPVLVEAEF